MRTLIKLALGMLLASLVMIASAQERPVSTAAAELKDTNGRVVGLALFSAVGDGAVRVQVWAGGLPPGQHGIHIHAVGKCEPDFGAAGAHFNPDGHKHGLSSPEGPHAGDLPNLVIGPDGNGALDVISPRIGLIGGSRSVFDTDGSAVIIHAGADDQVTDPTGNSGGRIACGAISAVAPPASMAVAAAQLKDASGHVVGSALFSAVGGGAVRVQVWAGGLPPGQHGIHVHAVGKCEPDFGAAGGHHNPQGKQHGAHNPNGAHGGDLPNLVIGPDGNGALDATTGRFSLTPGGWTIFDADGSAIVMHANADDEMTDPTGNSGGRIACGVISSI
jgi:superoxide dismutase, Cu-Zn family